MTNKDPLRSISLPVPGIFMQAHTWDATHIPCTCYEFSCNQRKSKANSQEGHSSYSAISRAPTTGTFLTNRNFDTTRIAYTFRCIGEELSALYVKTQVDCFLNIMAHTQKPDFVFWRNGRVHLNRRGRQFSRLQAAGVCASAVVMLDTQCSKVEWRALAIHSIRQFLLHFPSRASPCVITFQLDSTYSP
jgi:hypothetical protein